MKKCSKCGELKPTSEFNKDSSKRDRLHSSCRACDNIKKTAWRAANPNHQANWYADNREKQKAAASAWYAANRDKAKATAARYRANNPDKYKAAIAQWHAANPEARRTIRQNRRARKNGGKLSRGLRDKLFKLQRGKCACCGEPLGDYFHLDHIMPLALGGTNTDDNMQLLRAKCNSQKSAKHPVDFMQSKGLLL